jgi:hypothetical protein
MDKAVKDMGYPFNEFFGLDFAKEKGKKWLNSAAQKLVELVKEFKTMVREKVER